MARGLARAARAAALVAVAALVGGGSALGVPRPAKPAWRAATDSFRLTFLAGGTPVAQEAPDAGRPGGRLGYVLADGSTHGLGRVLGTRPVSGGTEYRVATDEAGRTARVTVRRAPAAVDVSLRLVPAGGVAATFDAFVSHPGEHFLGGGERAVALDLRGQALAIKVSHACGNAMPAPFFASSAGYGVALRSTAIAALAFPGSDPAQACAGGSEPLCPVAAHADTVQLCLKAPALSYRLFLGDPQAVVSGYTRLVGRPLVPPASQFELIKWRDAVDGRDQLLEEVSKLRSLGIPIGWVLLDNPWEAGLCYGSLQFDTGRFGDPEQLVQQLHAQHVRLMLWVSPLVRKQWCAPPPQYDASKLVDAGGNSATLDLTDPKTLATFESGLKALVALGVDGFKGDRGDEFDLESRTLAGGPGAAVQNTYPLLFERAAAQAVPAAKRKSFATIFRAAGPGSAATVPGFWGGDQPGTFDGLRQAIREGLSAGAAGYSTWGSDTGGYASADPPLTAETFVRWAQFSAISPVFEVGGQGPNATFWDFGAQTVSLFREAAVLHYELFPYLFGLARTAHATGIPVLRPLALAYPHDAQAWAADLEALVGPSLLAAPVTDAGTSARVYLPAGSWIDLATGATVRGGRSLVRPTPLAQLPLYLKAGSAIPFAAREPAIWPAAWPTDALTLPHRGGWLVAPGRSTSARDPRFGRLSATQSGATLELRLAGAPRETQVLVAGRGVPRTVEIGGRTVARARSLAALRSAREGWLPSATPFRGIVLKLAPAHGAATVSIRLR